MNSIEGNIVDIVGRRVYKGRILYSERIENIYEDESINSDIFILPGFIDAHIHIESTMLSPLEYSKIATKHGIIAAVCDPHEIANVCGNEGIKFMLNSAKDSPMKMFFGAPSCVPATEFESSGAEISATDIELLFQNESCSHLAEMMNFPGVINKVTEVVAKLEIAQKYNKVIDGHAPLLTGYDLRRYVAGGISTDHECASLYEALEKISLGMKIMLRNSSASKDFSKLISLIKTHPNEVMLCTDDCHPDDLEVGYINDLVKIAVQKGYSIFDVLYGATKTANNHYKLNVGMLQLHDSADFIVVDNLVDFSILSTTIDGKVAFNAKDGSQITKVSKKSINNFYCNSIEIDDIKVEKKGSKLNAIQIIADSLVTKKVEVNLEEKSGFICSDIENDLLKIVVLNRYNKAKPAVGFIKGFRLKRGAIAGSVAHDSHNIVAVGVDDAQIIQAIRKVQDNRGGLVAVSNDNCCVLPLPIGGLMSNRNCSEVAESYKEITIFAGSLGCKLEAPFMTLSFMSLFVIPELKIGDKGLFDVNSFNFIELQH